jgi:hypothetical protein
MVSDQQFIDIADRWHDPFGAPKGYIRGMSVAFARLYVLLRDADDDSASKKAVVRATAEPIGDADHDVLKFYAPELVAAGASTDTPDAKLVALCSVMMGLGMRESSGRHCVGADTPEDRHPLRRQLFIDYQGRTDLLDIFAEGVHCNNENWHNHGTGDGAKFQETMKKCPYFAVLYTVQFLRSHRKHWGPINRKEAKVKQSVVTLFADIQKILVASEQSLAQPQ